MYFCFCWFFLMSLIFLMKLWIYVCKISFNAVVLKDSDSVRDTMVLTVRGDGLDIPPFFIMSTSRAASYRSGRRCGPDETPVKGMTNQFMVKYIDHIKDYVQEPTLLIMDRHSSHTSPQTLDMIKSYHLPDGLQALHPLLLPPKSAFLISPLDMGAIAAMKAYYYTLDRSGLEKKKNAAMEAWQKVSNDAIRSFFRNCGLIGEETLDSIRQRFEADVRGCIPEHLENVWLHYQKWESGAVEVEGAGSVRDNAVDRPVQLEGDVLDGQHWQTYGRPPSSSM
jgi:hypothetical protein